MVAATGLALRIPPYSEQRPERLNILYVHDRQSNRAFWVLDSPPLPGGGAAAIPRELRHAAPFTGAPAMILPWSSRRYPVAPATLATTKATLVAPRGDDRVAGEDAIQLQLRLPQGERQVSLYAQQAAGLTRIDITGTRYTFDEIPTEDGFQRFHCFGPSCDGLSLTLHLEMGETLAALLVVSSASRPETRDVARVPLQHGESWRIHR
jgi:hypothetical protein